MNRFFVKLAIVLLLAVLAGHLLGRCATNLGESIRDERPTDSEVDV